MLIIVRGICSLLTSFDVYGTFRSTLMGQHLSDAHARDIATLTFDLAGDGPSRRYGSSSSVASTASEHWGMNSLPKFKLAKLAFNTRNNSASMVFNMFGL